jgi:hypothetical protein
VAADFGFSLDQVNWLGNIVACVYLPTAILVPMVCSKWGIKRCVSSPLYFRPSLQVQVSRRTPPFLSCVMIVAGDPSLLLLIVFLSLCKQCHISVGALFISAWVRYAGTARSLSKGGSYTLLIIGQVSSFWNSNLEFTFTFLDFNTLKQRPSNARTSMNVTSTHYKNCVKPAVIQRDCSTDISSSGTYVLRDMVRFEGTDDCYHVNICWCVIAGTLNSRLLFPHILDLSNGVRSTQPTQWEARSANFSPPFPGIPDILCVLSYSHWRI